MKLVWDMAPSEGNARNSEGSFIRMPNGGILYAYCRGGKDDGDCLSRLGIMKIDLDELK